MVKKATKEAGTELTLTGMGLLLLYKGFELIEAENYEIGVVLMIVGFALFIGAGYVKQKWRAQIESRTALIERKQDVSAS